MKEEDFPIVMHNYFNAVLRLRQDLRQRVQKHLIESGYSDITLEMSQLMYVLRALGNSSNQQEIADTISKTKSSVTSLIDNLIKRGMVERNLDTGDRRNNIISLTDKGQLFINSFYPTVYKTYDIGKISMSLDDMRRLTDTLNAIINL